MPKKNGLTFVLSRFESNTRPTPDCLQTPSPSQLTEKQRHYPAFLHPFLSAQQDREGEKPSLHSDWGSVDVSIADTDEQSPKKLEDDFDTFTSTKATDLSQPLVDAHIPFKIHIVKDHGMKARLCLEVERLGLCAVIMGSRGFGATKRGSNGRLGSVCDYCVRHCVCPVVVVRYSDEKDHGGTTAGDPVVSVSEYPDATDDRKDT